MNRDFKDYSQPYDIKQSSESSKYPDLSSYGKNPSTFKYPDLSTYGVPNSSKVKEPNLLPLPYGKNSNYENDDSVLSKYHIDQNFTNNDLMKSIVLAGDNATNIRNNHKRMFQTNALGPVQENFNDNESLLRILYKEANNFEINDLKPYDLHKSVIIEDNERKNLNLQVSCLEPQNDIILKGYLLKQSPRMFKNWEKRLCILKNQVFLYYLPQNMKSPAGCLDFNLLKIDLKEERNGGELVSFSMQAEKSFRTFYFKKEKQVKGESPELSLENWVRRIKQQIKGSDSEFKQKLTFDFSVKYWKIMRIFNKAFEKKANTMDILLFRGFHTNAKLQRLFTQSQYDHVAILYRTEDGLFILESTGTEGVGLCSWRQFVELRWNELYEKMVYRPLELVRTPDMIKKFQLFAKSVIGKNYEISAKKLLKKESMIYDPLIDTEKTFFCSELVATAYKYIGILPVEKSACTYWPGTFSLESNMTLLQGSLGDEYKIEF